MNDLASLHVHPIQRSPFLIGLATILLSVMVFLAGCAASSPDSSTSSPTNSISPATSPAGEASSVPSPAVPIPVETSDTEQQIGPASYGEIPAGVYAMMDWARVSGASGGQAFPWVQAGHYAFTWRQVNPDRGQFDWDLVDRWLAIEAGPPDAPTGKRVGLGVNAYEGGAGDAVPQWVLDAHPLFGYLRTQRARIAASEHPQTELHPALSIAFRLSGESNVQVAHFQYGVEGFEQAVDSWLDGARPHTNHSAETHLELGDAGQASLLLGVHVAGLPASAEVISATLTMYVVDIQDGGTPASSGELPIEAYGLSRPWKPAEATWLSPQQGDMWTIRGCNGVQDQADREELPAGSAVLTSAGPLVMDLNPRLVQRWIQEPTSNFGLLIKQARSDMQLPRYWDEGYLQDLAEMVNALAGRYGADPRVAWVEISVGIYGETTPENRSELKWSFAEAGLTSDIQETAKGLYSWVDTVKQIIDMYREAFPEKPLFLQYSNNFESVSERAVYVPYAVDLGIGLKHNGLLPDSIDGATYGGPAVGTFNIMFTYSQTVPLAWEFQVFPRTESNVYWALLNALDKRARLVMVQKDAITRTELIPIFEFANQYLGQTVETTQSVWVALRETERPAERRNTQFGNFTFGLQQQDAGPGGQTVPLWNVTSTKEGRFTRRTDQASGNPHMYFDVDDQYFRGGRPVSIEVTYLDRGRDRWHLEYDGGEDAPRAVQPVQKTDTDNWKTARFTLIDARMQGGLAGYDFRIDCEGDGDEIIHRVQLSILDG